MAIERERKFLLANDSWRDIAGNGTEYVQGYISSGSDTTVRIRIAGNDAFITIKGQPLSNDPAARHEYEYSIPYGDAEEMLKSLCAKGQVEKTRYKIPFAGNIWEVDEFSGANQGLIVAEVEFADKDQIIEQPEWIGKEVTDDRRYTNAALAKTPYKEW